MSEGASEKKSVRGRRDLDNETVSDEGSFYQMSEDERDVINAKLYLQTKADPFTPSLYDHLSALIGRLLDAAPGSGLPDVSDLSSMLKRERLVPPAPYMNDTPPRSHTTTLAHAQWDMLKRPPLPVVNPEMPVVEEGSPLPEERKAAVPDVMKLREHLELAGTGLSQEEAVRLSLALRDLVADNPDMKSVRLWGKILGTCRSYWVAEGEFPEGAFRDDVSDTHDQIEAEELPSDLREEDSSLLDDELLPEDLKPAWRPPPKVPCEVAGVGLNKKTYYVTHEPGLPWIRLPHVTPAQIQAARKIQKFLTGDLEAQVVSNPPFPGLERNYLRAQIARISANTHISPLGYYRFDDEGEEEEAGEEESGGRMAIIEDVEFEGLSVRDLADGGLQAWVHHSPAILPQGRTTWWNPAQPKGDYEGEEEENENEEEEREEPDEPEPESGPPLLTPLAEDDNVGISPAWLACLSSKFVPEYAVAVLRSATWPGAVAFAADKGRYFDNFYVGWGVKCLEDAFDPTLPEAPLPEFPSGPEVTEVDDPTPEEEAAVRAALQEKAMAAEFEQQLGEDDDEAADDDD